MKTSVAGLSRKAEDERVSHSRWMDSQRQVAPEPHLKFLQFPRQDQQRETTYPASDETPPNVT